MLGRTRRAGQIIAQQSPSCCNETPEIMDVWIFCPDYRFAARTGERRGVSVLSEGKSSVDYP
jgi:hypothetical protein